MSRVAEATARLKDKTTKYDVRNRLGTWWAALPRAGRWAIMLAFVAFCYVLPNLTIPILDTETPWASILFSPIALYVLAAIGLNIVVGYAGLLDLGYVAFYAIGAYTVGVPRRTPASIARAMAMGRASQNSRFPCAEVSTATV